METIYIKELKEVKNQINYDVKYHKARVKNNDETTTPHGIGCRYFIYNWLDGEVAVHSWSANGNNHKIYEVNNIREGLKLIREILS